MGAICQSLLRFTNNFRVISRGKVDHVRVVLHTLLLERDVVLGTDTHLVPVPRTYPLLGKHSFP